jgi:acetoin utilization deacetylase AcuC-like enzyme
MKIITDERCTSYSAPGHPERPERIHGTVAKLKKQTELPITWGRPISFDDSVFLRAHTAAHSRYPICGTACAY